MKVVIAVAAVFLGLGYGLGTLREEIGDEEEKVPVVFVGSKGSRVDGRRTGVENRETWRGRREAELRALVMGASSSQEARLSKWILELEAEDFPDVFDLLKEMEKRKLLNRRNENAVAGLVRLALVRWYEVSGESVLDWVRSAPSEWIKGVSSGDGAEGIVSEMLLDGFQREPGESFRLYMEHFGVLRKVGEQAESLGRYDLLVALGSWSTNLAQDLAVLQKEENGGAMSFQRMRAGEYFGFTEGTALLAGIIDAGRVDLLPVLDDIFGVDGAEVREEGKVLIAWAEGGARVKELVEKGDVELSASRLGDVMDKLARKSGRQEAIDWYLAEVEGKQSRAESLARVVRKNGPFSWEEEGGGVFNDSGFDLPLAVEFVEEMESKGEPVEEAMWTLASMALDDRKWELARRLKEKLSEDERLAFEERLIKEAIRHRHLVLEGEELDFAEFADYRGEGAREFGLADEVEARVRKANQEAWSNLSDVINGAEERD